MSMKSRLQRARWTAAPAVAAIALTLAACGDGTPSDAATATEAAVTTAPAESTPASAPEPEDLAEVAEQAAAEPTAVAAVEPEQAAEPVAAEPNGDAQPEEVAEPAATEPAESGRPAIQLLSADEAIVNAQNNIDELQLADSVLDIEVLAVADGSVQTVRDVVTGDRPVLLWFFSPH